MRKHSHRIAYHFGIDAEAFDVALEAATRREAEREERAEKRKERRIPSRHTSAVLSNMSSRLSGKSASGLNMDTALDAYGLVKATEPIATGHNTAIIMAGLLLASSPPMIEQQLEKLLVDISIGAGSLEYSFALSTFLVDLGAFLHEQLYNLQHELFFTRKRQSVYYCLMYSHRHHGRPASELP